MRKAKLDWEGIRGERQRQVRERDRQRRRAAYQMGKDARSGTPIEECIYKHRTRFRVVWRIPHPVTTLSRLKSKSFPLSTPLPKLRAYRDARRRDAARLWVPVLEERKRKDKERRDAQKIAAKLASTRMREERHREALARERERRRETATRIDTNISRVARKHDGRLRGFRVQVRVRDPETGKSRVKSRRFPPNAAHKEMVRYRDDIKTPASRQAAPQSRSAARNDDAAGQALQRLLDDERPRQPTPGQRLGALLQELGWGYEHAAARFGISSVSVGRYVNDLRTPRLHDQRRIADILGKEAQRQISPADLFGTRRKKAIGSKR